MLELYRAFKLVERMLFYIILTQKQYYIQFKKRRLRRFCSADDVEYAVAKDLTQYDLTSMKIGIYGGAAMAPALVKECKERLYIDLVQIYGMTEMGPVVAFLVEEDQITKAGSAGTPCFSHEIRIVKPNEDAPAEPDDVLPPYEVGEIILRGPTMMAGYHNREEANAKSMYKGWYHSGDLGYFDKDGYLFVADRVDDMVISGGVNIYPREIEDFLHSHPGILDVAVLGEPDELWENVLWQLL